MPHPSDPARAGPPIPFIGDPPAAAAWLRVAALWPHGDASAVLPPPCDPDVLADLAVRHRLVPVLHGFMIARGVPPPPPLTDALRAAAVRTLRQTALLARVMPALEAAGVRALVLKGLPLSAQLYGRADLRSAVDIDLLVAPDSAAPAHAVLMAAGCRPASGAAVESPSGMEKDAGYVGPHGEPVELHWRLTRNRHLLPWDFEDLWAEASAVPPVALGHDLSVRTLPPERQAVYVALHGAQHGWQRARWLVDAALCLRTPGLLAQAMGRARRDGLEHVVAHARAAARHAFGAAADPAADAPPPASAHARALAWAVERLAETRARHGDGGLDAWVAQRPYALALNLLLCADVRARVGELGLLRPLLLARRLVTRTHPWRRTRA